MTGCCDILGYWNGGGISNRHSPGKILKIADCVFSVVEWDTTHEITLDTSHNRTAVQLNGWTLLVSKSGSQRDTAPLRSSSKYHNLIISFIFLRFPTSLILRRFHTKILLVFLASTNSAHRNILDLSSTTSETYDLSFLFVQDISPYLIRLGSKYCPEEK